MVDITVFMIILNRSSYMLLIHNYILYIREYIIGISISKTTTQGFSVSYFEASPNILVNFDNISIQLLAWKDASAKSSGASAVSIIDISGAEDIQTVFTGSEFMTALESGDPRTYLYNYLKDNDSFFSGAVVD